MTTKMEYIEHYLHSALPKIETHFYPPPLGLCIAKRRLQHHPSRNGGILIGDIN